MSAQNIAFYSILEHKKGTPVFFSNFDNVDK